MRPDTILVPTGCDLRRLPLDASEVFLLSRLDGQLTLEEIGEIAGLGFDKARRLAERLVILGAVKPLKGGTVEPPPEPVSGDGAPKRRIDPRAEAGSMRPPRADAIDTSKPKRTSLKGGSMRPPKGASMRPRAPSARPAPPPEQKKRRSTRSMKAQHPAIAPPPVEEVCEIDEEMQEKIHEMDAKLRTASFYELLGVERDADRKEIKRAYFALAAVFHPDRFFGKKLGPLRPVLERVFVRLTEANDALGSRQRREAYDAMLPPVPSKPVKAVKEEATPVPGPEKKPSKTMPAPRLSPAPRKMSKAMRRSRMMAAAQAATPPPDPAAEREKFQRLQATAKLLASQTRAEALVKAAEEAVRAGDIMGAANNYRLALQMHEDPVIKEKLAAIDRHSRDLRHEKYLAKARAAERAERWEEAADHFIRANEARKDAVVAERAAYALRLSNGDLRQATSLAEQAVEENGKNAEYRVTLGEILLAAKLIVRAKEESAEALSLAPNNPRAKSLAAALKKL